MTTCISIKGKKREVCSGDLDRWITIQQRTMTVPLFDTTDYTETFTDLISMWSMIDTKKGISIFDGTDMERTVDAMFYVNFIPTINITAESWILFEGVRHKILQVEDLDNRHEFLCLYTTIRGTDQNSVNAQ
jgi:head-tail adaptor